MLVKFPVWLNLIIYILLILGILWVSKKLYSSFNETSNNKQIKIIGIIMFAISILVGIFALFGMAK